MALGEFLLLGKGEDQNGGRERKTLLANAMEAVIAAMHLDGGLEVAKHFIETQILVHLESLKDVDSGGLLNHKSLLQERAQALGFSFPRYVTVGVSGPEHAKQFTIEARVGDLLTNRATASSKKAASQQAAEGLCRMLESSEADTTLLIQR